MVGSAGRSLELYFIDGNPEGMQTAALSNWNGHVLTTPRVRIGAALDRPEARYVGIYFLLGQKQEEAFAYIGEGEDISDRIRSHEQKKDWWTEAVLVTTGTNVLHKAQAKYLESRLVEIARHVKRRALENRNIPQRPHLSEAQQASMESFLENLLMILPALRVDMFQDYTKTNTITPTEAVAVPVGPVFELENKKHGLSARATLAGGDFTVHKDSSARLQWEGKGGWDDGYARLHAELLRTGVLVADGARCVFAKSYAFRSPRAAAAVVNGRPGNGNKEWKVACTGQTYKEWEAAQIGADAPEAA